MENADVAGRLAQGQPAVDNVAEYVWACRLLGYQHQDLTRHPGQVQDWYGTEDGLDLRALDADIDALAAAAVSAEQALQQHDNQVSGLAEAWQGNGARASREFLERHGAAAREAVAAVRAAAETLSRLRDNLWRAVDDKVAAAVQIEGAQAGQRSAWLAAARAVSTGVGDRAAASELIDQQVKPFVVNDIGGQWVAAMRTGTVAAADAYDDAVTALRGRQVPVFDVPGDLGPSRLPGVGVAVAALMRVPSNGGGAATVPAGFTPGWAAPPSPALPAAPANQAPSAAPANQVPSAGMPGPPMDSPMSSALPAAATPASSGLDLGSALGGGLPDLGSAVPGLGRQLADMFGGLIGSAADGLPSDIGDPLADRGPDARLDEPGIDEADDDAQEEDDTAEEADKQDEPEPVDPAGEPPEIVEPQPVTSTIAPELPETAPPPAEPASQVEPLAAPAGESPCAIAAEELPRVGG
ncbi:uncharacterized protein YukE [Mycobacterium frederiksbergense]|uniref:Uncharacterized protein YukE n=1 Tax=Mycolicibacterium frederiksbergense TaxID=117567 RepID=A0ABT6L325_9MYCO|nr:hypothetical protein [Mycolicibacterium frederiksbergense]MDH6197026.1 uncharacterized protein YukE [Mycolicibacterium frederiksbergense]